LLRIQWATFSLQFSYRRITVKSNHEDVTELFGSRQVADMSGVQDIETTVGEDNRFPWVQVSNLPSHRPIQNLRRPNHRFFVLQ
jgi:hypothetical protein